MRRLQRQRLARRKIKKGAPPTIDWYSVRFKVDRCCAAKELMELGHCTAEDYIREGGVIKEKVEKVRRKSRRSAKRVLEAQGLPEGCWVEGGEAPEYGISFIAGFTDGGCPFGLTYDQFDPTTGLAPSRCEAGELGAKAGTDEVDDREGEGHPVSMRLTSKQIRVPMEDDKDEVPF